MKMIGPYAYWRNRVFLALLLFFGGMTASCAASTDQLKLIKRDQHRAHYEGSIVVSGIYHEQIRRSEMLNYEKGLICFSVRGETERLVPREKNDSRSPWFCFTNTADARAALKVPSKAPEGTCYIIGAATVQISNYAANTYPSEVHDKARLDKVITVDKASFKKECSLF